MTDIRSQLVDELSAESDLSAFHRANDAAHRRADRIVRRRRITAGSAAVAVLGLTATLAFTLPLGGQQEGGIAPAAPPPLAAGPAPTVKVAPLVAENGYYAHPEIMKPGEPPVWEKDRPQPFTSGDDTWRFAQDAPAASGYPRMVPNPRGSRFADLRLVQYFGASKSSAIAGVEPGCDPAYGGGKLQPEIGRQMSYWHRGDFLAHGDGDMTATLPRQSVSLNSARFAPGTTDLISSFLSSKMQCVPMRLTQGATEVPGYTVAGADRAWLAHGRPDPLYGRAQSFLMIEKGRHLISVSSQAKTQELADAQARWFAETAFSTLQASGAK